MAKTEGTDAERARAKELFGIRSDKRIAVRLIEEGFDGKVASGAAGRILQVERVRKRVGRHRLAIRKEWRATRRLLTSEDRAVSTEEYIANLETREEQLEDVLDDANLRGTPRVQALGELRQIEQAIAKARGVDVMPGDDREGTPDGPLGPTVLVLDLSRCSDAVKKKADDGDDE